MGVTAGARRSNISRRNSTSKKPTTTVPKEQGHHHLSRDNHRPGIDRTVGNTVQCVQTVRATEVIHLIAKERDKRHTNDMSKPGGLTKVLHECVNVDSTTPMLQIGYWYEETGQATGVDAQDVT